jgi:hypothetical protein
MTPRLGVLGWALVALGVYAAGATYLLMLRRDRAAEVRREADAAALRAAGAVVAEPATPRAISATLAPVADQVAAVRRAVPSARPVEALTWRTDTMTVPCPAAEPAARPPAHPTVVDKLPELRIEARGTEARLETDNGAVAAVGEVELWRTAPPPEEMLGRRAWRADVSRLLRAEPMAPRRGWAAGPAIGWSRGGAVYGAVVVTPPVRVLGVDAAAWAAGAAGHGDGIAMAGVLVGW